MDAPGRVLGWDMLRGLCALAVASYHLLYWQDVASLHSFGSYGVYLFFVLSGASLAYNYAGKLSGAREVVAFLATRWLRLAPLYISLCIVFVLMLSARNAQWVDQLPFRFALNGTFAFGVHDPVVWALLIGGWSLGIEFVYYLAFPLVLATLSRRVLWLPIAGALTALQWYWIYRTVGSEAGYAASAVAYHQVPAFAAYFFGGCVIGYWRRQRSMMLAQAVGTAVWLSMAVLLLALNPAEAGGELLGWRGATLFAACFAVVHLSGHVDVTRRFTPLAKWLGDITYGCYLLHPMFFFGWVWFVLPHFTATDVAELPLAVRFATWAAVLALSCATATASERWFEAPLRRWGKRKLAGRTAPAAPYKDAASISS